MLGRAGKGEERLRAVLWSYGPEERKKRKAALVPGLLGSREEQEERLRAVLWPYGPEEQGASFLGLLLLFLAI